MSRNSLAIRALLAQSSALALVAVLARHGVLICESLWIPALLVGALAALLSAALRLPRWWWWLQALFMPAVVAANALQLPYWVYAAGLGALLLVYGAVFRTGVPLFLSSHAAAERLVAWLPDDGSVLRVIDLGSGTGRMMRDLARLRPHWRVDGVEQALLPWWLSRIAIHGMANARVWRGDFWQQPLEDYDVIYAFLSPVPMPTLWTHVQGQRQRPGWLVSNSFPMPGRAADSVLEVDDRRHTRLYCYRLQARTALRTARRSLGRGLPAAPASAHPVEHCLHSNAKRPETNPPDGLAATAAKGHYAGMPRIHDLGDDEIHLWYLPYAGDHGRRQLHKILASYCGAAPDSLVLWREEHGRPQLQGHGAWLHFNWSHSHGWACVALARGLPYLGVDIERLRPRPRAERLARRFFDADEARWVESADGDERVARFLRLWTAKEAVLKAQGRGLGLGIARARFVPKDGLLAPSWSDQALGDSACWRVERVSEVPDCVGALAWRDGDRRRVCRGLWPDH